MKIVRIRNTSDRDFRDMYANERYLIRAHSESMVPFDAARLWLGDPALVDRDASNRDRTFEFSRLMVRFGVYENVGKPEFEVNLPRGLEVFDTEGDRIFMVLEDPDGTRVADNPDPDQGLDEMTRLKAEYAALTSRLAALEAQAQQKANPVIVDRADALDVDVAGLVLEVDPDITLGAPTEDTPTRVRVGGKR